MKVRVETNSQEFRFYLRRVEKEAHTSLTRALQRAAIMVQQSAKMETPVAFGMLRNSLAYEIVEVLPGRYDARVGTPSKYGKYVEFGTSPHLVVGTKDDPIGLWILRKMTNMAKYDRQTLRKGGKAGKAIVDRLTYMRRRLLEGKKVGIRVSGKAQPFLVPALEYRRAEIRELIARTLGEGLGGTK